VLHEAGAWTSYRTSQVGGMFAAAGTSIITDARSFALAVEFPGALTRLGVRYGTRQGSQSAASAAYATWAEAQEAVMQHALGLQQPDGRWTFPATPRGLVYMDCMLLIALYRAARFHQPHLMGAVKAAIDRWAAMFVTTQLKPLGAVHAAGYAYGDPPASTDLNTFYLAPLLLAGDTASADLVAAGTGQAYLGSPTNYTHSKRPTQFLLGQMALALRIGETW
jgi:hypothetical protein